MNNPNDPAYPTDKRVSTAHWGQMTESSTIMRSGGMTIRQRFVMAAMQGLCANPTTQFDDIISGSVLLGSVACTVADAALAEEARTRSKA